jgi:hypothetical protein
MNAQPPAKSLILGLTHLGGLVRTAEGKKLTHCFY